MKKNKIMLFPIVGFVLISILTGAYYIKKEQKLFDCRNNTMASKNNLIANKNKPEAICVRKMPFPYRNMFSLTDDADAMDGTKFEIAHKFLNTTSDCGSLGTGVGLDISDSFFMGEIGNPGNQVKDKYQWYYWNTNTNEKLNALAMKKYIDSGWIDTPHTFFSYAHTTTSSFNRKKVEAIINEWNDIGFKPILWSDHWNNPWNIMNFDQSKLSKSAKIGDSSLFLKNKVTLHGDDYLIFPSTGEKVEINNIQPEGDKFILYLNSKLQNNYVTDEYLTIHSSKVGNEGAVPGSSFYCIDLAIKAGIKAFWIDLPSDIQKETDNGILGFNTCLTPERLPNNQMVWGFLRNYQYAQTDNTWLGKCINRELYGDKFSNYKPAKPDTYIVITSHIGYSDADGSYDNNSYKPDFNVFKYNDGNIFNTETVTAFRNLKAEQDQGKILVTRPTRLVKYNLANDMLAKYANTTNGYTVKRSGDKTQIIIHEIHDDCFGSYVPTIDDLRGITFYCSNPDNTEIWINNTPISSSEIQKNTTDNTGKKSISIKWYTQDITDYTTK